MRWVCDVPGEGDVAFVTAADAAAHGIHTANAKAGQVFHDQFGEVCRGPGILKRWPPPRFGACITVPGEAG